MHRILICILYGTTRNSWTTQQKIIQTIYKLIPTSLYAEIKIKIIET